MVRNDDLGLTSTTRCEIEMTDTRSVISPKPHSVPSNLNHTVESETLCQSRLLTETTECLLDMPNDDTGMTKLDDVLIPGQALSLSWLTSNCNTRTHDS